MNLYALAYVPDPAASVAFYESAFGVPVRFVADGNTYAELDTPGVTMGFVADLQAEENLPRGYRPNRRGEDAEERPAGFEFGFEVADVEAAWQRALAAGAEPYAEPADKPWGQRIAYVLDRDGILVELAQALQ